MNQSQSAVLGDKIVRQALDMIVDRNAIIDNILFGYGVAISGPLPLGLFNSTSSDLSTGERNISSTSSDVFGTSSSQALITTARVLLEKNGWKKGVNGIYGKKTKLLVPAIYTKISLGPENMTLFCLASRLEKTAICTLFGTLRKEMLPV